MSPIRTSVSLVARLLRLFVGARETSSSPLHDRAPYTTTAGQQSSRASSAKHLSGSSSGSEEGRIASSPDYRMFAQ
jgi:hypothetical protein